MRIHRLKREDTQASKIQSQNKGKKNLEETCKQKLFSRWGLESEK